MDIEEEVKEVKGGKKSNSPKGSFHLVESEKKNKPKDKLSLNLSLLSETSKRKYMTYFFPENQEVSNKKRD